MFRFKGKIKKLKGMGFIFQKLFADNRKTYRLGREFCMVWVHVRNGGFIEINDYFNCSELIYNEIREIEWQNAPINQFGNYKYVDLWFAHCKPEIGAKVFYGGQQNDHPTPPYDRRLHLRQDDVRFYVETISRIQASAD